MTLMWQCDWILNGYLAIYMIASVVVLFRTIININVAENDSFELNQFKTFLNHTFLTVLGATVRLLTGVFILCMVVFEKETYTMTATIPLAIYFGIRIIGDLIFSQNTKKKGLLIDFLMYMYEFGQVI